MSKTQKSLIIASQATLGLLVGIMLLVFTLHQLHVINAWLLPLQAISVFLFCGSCACFGLAKMMAVPGQQDSTERQHRWRKRLLYWGALLLVAINVLSYVTAYSLTHVRGPGQFGIGLPKPMNISTPSDRGLPYTTHRLAISSSAWLEAWLIPTTAPTAQGTVLLFPGNRSTKDRQLISPAQSFAKLGYDSLLIDYRGMGGSSGNTTTVGMHEAQDVGVATESVQTLDLKSPLILYGVSMGSAAILRAMAVTCCPKDIGRSETIATTNLHPDAIIIELPFARLIDAVRSRLRRHHIPTFPVAELLVFWGSVQHSVNGFGHNPVDFAQSVTCPTLIIHGQQDPWTTVAEVEKLFHNLPQPKKLVISPNAGHHQLIGVDRPLWEASIMDFLQFL